MEELRKQLGKKIREAREEKSFTQKQLGRALGYSSMAISHFEKGIRELKISSLQKLSKVLDKDLSFFLPPQTTFFRANQSYNQRVKKSLDDFDKFISRQKKKK